MSHTVAHNPNLYQWKRFAKKKSVVKTAPKQGNDIESWLRKVEEATDRAVETTFADENPVRRPRQRPSYYAEDDIMQTVDRLRDDDAAHEEAQELVTNWMNEKLRYNFLDEEDDSTLPDPARHRFTSTTGNRHPSVETATHEKWYEDSETFIQNYLQSSDTKSSKQTNRQQPAEDDFLGSVNIYEADENSVVQALMKKMMDKPVIKKKTMKKMQIDDSKPETKQRKTKDPRTTMEMRHKEVKEARLRRQREDDRRKQEEMIKREAKFKAQQILKKEETKKALRAKQEEEAIQMEMAKLRKEMIEQRKREEITKKERDKIIEEAIVKEEEQILKRRQELDGAEREKQKKRIMDEISRLEKKKQRVGEMMKEREINNRRLLHQCLSTWCKMVMSQRVKLGKAKAMSDWKCMQKAWVAWKTYTRNQRLDQETRIHQDIVREWKLKQKRATDCERSKLLRKCFLAWKVWIKTEQERKEILKKQESTKAKMRALLDAVASGNVKSGTHSEQPTTLQSIDSSEEEQAALALFEAQKPTNVPKPKKTKDQRQLNKTGKPKHAWQVTKKDVRSLKPEQMRSLKDNSPRSDTQGSSQRDGPVYDPYQNRHKFQKEVIDQQRMLLQEQKRMIEEMQEHQRLKALQNEIAVLKENQEKLSQVNLQNVGRLQPAPVSTTVTNPITTEIATEPQSARSLKSDNTRLKKHPIVSKMEERAAERMKKRKELDEIRRKKEEEKVRKLQEEEERKQREEQEQKERELEAKREARRLQRKLEAEKKAQQERMQELSKMADDHYRASLIKNYGFAPWKRMMQSMDRKTEVATYQYNTKLMRKALEEWKRETDSATEERERRADILYRAVLLRRGLCSWMKYGERMEILEQKAVMHHNKVLLKNYLKNWVDYTTDEKLGQWDKESRADAHNRTRMVRRVFNVIRGYRTLVLREEERKKRLAEMRRKVTQLLPDFQNPRESTASDVTGDDDGEP